MESDVAKYMKKGRDADIKRLRQQLCRAWRQSQAGLKWGWGRSIMSAAAFADTLAQHGVPCKKTDVENAKGEVFVPHCCPPTDEVVAALNSLTLEFADLSVSEFLVEKGNNVSPIEWRSESACPFVARVQ